MIHYFSLIVAALLLQAAAPVAAQVNAKFFRFNSSGTLQGVGSHTWKRDWHSVVSTEAANGAPLLLFYAREYGWGKVFRYSAAGGMTPLNSWKNWLKDWDFVVGGKFGTANAVFYRRRDGFLRAYDFGPGGEKRFRFSQTIEDPNGSTLYAKTGWDVVISGKWGDQKDGLFLYHRTTGRARFYVYSPSSNRFVKVFSYYGFQKTWDEIAAGDFNGDANDDLVFYNQDSGLLKILYLDAERRIKGTWQTKNAGRTHGARLVTGNFDGGYRDDILVYQQDNGASFENGSARIYADTASGYRYVSKTYTHWQDKWTHAVRVRLGPGRAGLLLYSNQHLIRVAVIPMSSSGSQLFQWTSQDAVRLAELQKAMRKTYATAGLKFEFYLYRFTKQHAGLATWVCGTGGDRASANAFIAANIPSFFLPFTVATESTSGTGCSNALVDFVRVGYPITAKTKHFAHEAGHYFGLPHSHLGLKTRTAVEDYLTDKEATYSRNAIAGDIDRDRLEGSEFLSVLDTPPILSNKYWENEGMPGLDQCDEGKTVSFETANGTLVRIAVNPHNVMAYNNCNQLYRLTRDQAQTVRETLYSKRFALIQ